MGCSWFPPIFWGKRLVYLGLLCSLLYMCTEIIPSAPARPFHRPKSSGIGPGAATVTGSLTRRKYWQWPSDSPVSAKISSVNYLGRKGGGGSNSTSSNSGPLLRQVGYCQCRRLGDSVAQPGVSATGRLISRPARRPATPTRRPGTLPVPVQWAAPPRAGPAGRTLTGSAGGAGFITGIISDSSLPVPVASEFLASSSL